MLSSLSTRQEKNAVPILLVTAKSYAAWLKQQDAFRVRWLESIQFEGDGGSYALVPSPKGDLALVVAGIGESLDSWSIAHLTSALPVATYRLENKLTVQQGEHLCLGWALAAYQFSRYKKKQKRFARLTIPAGVNAARILAMVESIHWVRDMINTPANDMLPSHLAAECTRFAQSRKAKCQVIVGEDLLKQNYPMIHTVGRASADAPRLVDIRWGKSGMPKITLVGKGVCFDSGGLDIKSTANMKLMKKDMGGAACALGLARMIIDNGLPVQLRVLIPAVENAISGSAMRPMDISPTRKGIHVEIGNTDAEGRLVLCDALFEADQDKPDLLVDFATLTGAARVALGTDLPALFSNQDDLADALLAHASRVHDPVWRLPLWQGYREQLKTYNADISNDPDSSYGGAITAALFLKEFVNPSTPWLHIDMMAWNPSNRPGRPQGGEAMAIRALFSLIEERYGHR